MRRHPSLILLPQPLAATSLSFVLRICLFWTFHINGVSAACSLPSLAPLELSMLFPRSTHI